MPAMHAQTKKNEGVFHIVTTDGLHQDGPAAQMHGNRFSPESITNRTANIGHSGRAVLSWITGTEFHENPHRLLVIGNELFHGRVCCAQQVKQSVVQLRDGIVTSC